MKSPHKVETEGRGEGAGKGLPGKAPRGDLTDPLIFTCLRHAAAQLRETRLHPLQLLPVLSAARDEGEQVFLQEAGWAGAMGARPRPPQQPVIPQTERLSPRHPQAHTENEQDVQKL